MSPLRIIKKAAIFVAGIAVIIVGIILLPLPGPGFLVIGLGLLILSTEFEWADRYLHKLKKRLGDAYAKAKGSKHTPKQ